MNRCYRGILYLGRGITLVELIVVIGAISIILGACMPSIKSVGSGLMLHVEAIQMAQDIRYAQQLTLTRGEKYKLEMNRAKNYYYIKSATRARQGSVKRVELNKHVYIKECHTLSGSGNHYYIEFNAKSGLPSRTGTIVLSDHYGNIREIVIAVGTGRVRIE